MGAIFQESPSNMPLERVAFYQIDLLFVRQFHIQSGVPCRFVYSRRWLFRPAMPKRYLDKYSCSVHCYKVGGLVSGSEKWIRMYNRRPDFLINERCCEAWEATTKLEINWKYVFRLQNLWLVAVMIRKWIITDHLIFEEWIMVNRLCDFWLFNSEITELKLV